MPYANCYANWHRLIPVGKRRANHEGSLTRLPNGTWQARLTYTDQATGQGKRLAFYGPTAKAAAAKMKKARERLDAGAPPKDATRTIADWLAHWRTTTLAVSDRAENTRSNYAALSRKHLEPEPFGAITLDRLRPTDIEKLILALRDDGLSDSTVRSTYTVLRLALDGAVRDGLLARNPGAQVRRPGVKRREAKHLDAGAVTAVLRAAEDSRYHTALVLAAATGLRRGEVCALRWDAVDLDAGTLRVISTVSRVDRRLVFSEPKTDRSRRTVPLSPAVVAMLKKHRTTQKEDRLRAGNQWTETGFVFTTEFGTVVDPRNLLRVIQVAAKKVDVEGIGAHTLRHSAATAWLEAGVPLKIASDLLGHSSVAITADIYMHGSHESARAAVDTLASRLGL